MLIAFSARDVMQVLILIASALGVLVFLWPWALSRSILWRSRSNKIGALLEDHAGVALIFVTAVFTLALYIGFVVADDQLGWWNPEPAITALAIVLAVAFGYTRLIPPAFFPTYHAVHDLQDGDWSDEKVERMTIPNQEWAPIFLVIHNTGITPWNNYRITVRFEDGFDVEEKEAILPAHWRWDWETKGLRVIKARSSVLLQAGNTLAVAEGQTLRFFVKSPARPGPSQVRVSVVSDGRLSESRRELWLDVVEKAES